MFTWLEGPIEAEKQRRAKFAVATRVLARYIGALKLQMESDIESFSRVFPSNPMYEGARIAEMDAEHVSVSGPKFRDASPTADIRVNPFQETLYVNIFSVADYRFKFPIQIVNEIAQPVADITTEALSALILYPVLFPHLPHDPAIYKPV